MRGKNLQELWQIKFIITWTVINKIVISKNKNKKDSFKFSLLDHIIVFTN